MSKDKFHVGDKVVFIGASEHASLPQYYPKFGTIGTVTIGTVDGVENNLNTKVQWPRGSTSDSDNWWVNHKWIKPICSE